MATAPKAVLIKAKVVAQDIEWGLDQVVQLRNGKRVTGNQVNSAHIPYTSLMSVATALDKIITKIGGLS